MLDPPFLMGLRNTPTCVGTTNPAPDMGLAVEEHPHVRGDNAQIKSDAWSEAGTPPRAWGQLRTYSPDAPADRNTPTCVGTTFLWL